MQHTAKSRQSMLSSASYFANLYPIISLSSMTFLLLRNFSSNIPAREEAIMGVYKKDNRWYIDYYLSDGTWKREVVSIKGKTPERITREDAKKALAIRKAEFAQGKFE